MNLRKQIKYNAHRALSGNWGKAICLFLIAFSMVILFSTLQTLVSLLLNIPDFQDVFHTPGVYLDDRLNLSPAALWIAGAFAAASLIVNAPLHFGIRRWYYRLAGGHSEDVTSIFHYFCRFRLFCTAIWYHVQLAVRQALWGALFGFCPTVVGSAALFLLQRPSGGEAARFAGSLLAALSGLLFLLFSVFFLVFSNRYLLTAYLLADHPGLTVRQAFQLSVRYTKGQRGALFLFRLSFLPWLFLSVLLLPALYATPYYRTSLALYAKYLIERGRRVDPGAEEAVTMQFDFEPPHSA